MSIDITDISTAHAAEVRSLRAEIALVHQLRWTAEQETQRLRAEVEALRAALTELMKYVEHTRRIGGVENGYDIPTGEALGAVLDECKLILERTK